MALNVFNMYVKYIADDLGVSDEFILRNGRELFMEAGDVMKDVARRALMAVAWTVPCDMFDEVIKDLFSLACEAGIHW